MQFKVMTTIFALALVTEAAWASAKDLHVTKECSAYQGGAGQFCTITSSNLAAIKVGSKVFYDQAAGIPSCSTPTNISPPCPASVFLDSNVVLYVGTGDWGGRPVLGRSGDRFGTVHVLGRDRTAHRVPSQCRCLVYERSKLPLGWNVQLWGGGAAIG